MMLFGKIEINFLIYCLVIWTLGKAFSAFLFRKSTHLFTIVSFIAR